MSSTSKVMLVKIGNGFKSPSLKLKLSVTPSVVSNNTRKRKNHSTLFENNNGQMLTKVFNKIRPRLSIWLMKL